MKRDMGAGHAPRVQSRKQRIVEMERSGGGRDRAGLACPDGLIILAVLRIRPALGLDIGWERHSPGLGQCRIERRARQVEGQYRLPFGA